jgi:hypothetical protein
MLSDTGIALLISALIQHSSLDLYHMHIIYDTVNFTAYVHANTY